MVNIEFVQNFVSVWVCFGEGITAELLNLCMRDDLFTDCIHEDLLAAFFPRRNKEVLSFFNSDSRYSCFSSSIG
jgi:hypothetical protein